MRTSLSAVDSVIRNLSVRRSSEASIPVLLMMRMCYITMPPLRQDGLCKYIIAADTCKEESLMPRFTGLGHL